MNVIPIDILVSAQGALFECVTPNLRAVYIDTQNNSIETRCYYNDPPDEGEIELISLANTYFVSDFSEPGSVKPFQIINIRYPNTISDLGYCVFFRYEPSEIKFSSYLKPIPPDILTTRDLAPIFRLLGIALLGRITSNLKAVAFSLSDSNVLEVEFYYATIPSALELELFNAVSAEVLKACPPPLFQFRIKTIVMPEALKIEPNALFVYRRYDPIKTL